MAEAIQRDRADGAEVLPSQGVRVHLAGRFERLGLAQLRMAGVGVEPGVVDPFHIGHAVGELLGTRTDQHHVRRVLHHRPRQHDGVADGHHARHRPCTTCMTLHQRGVQLVPAMGVVHRALACIEAGQFLQRHHGGLRGIQGRTPGGQHGLASIQRLLELGVGGPLVRGAKRAALDHAGAGMDHQRMEGNSNVHGRDR